MWTKASRHVDCLSSGGVVEGSTGFIEERRPTEWLQLEIGSWLIDPSLLSQVWNIVCIYFRSVGGR